MAGTVYGGQVTSITPTKPSLLTSLFDQRTNNRSINAHDRIPLGRPGEAGADADADAQALAQAREPGVIFRPATGIACEAVAQVRASLRKRILRA